MALNMRYECDQNFYKYMMNILKKDKLNELYIFILLYVS